MPFYFGARGLKAAAFGLFVGISLPAHAVLTQSDGTVIPVMTGTDCNGNIQVCLDTAEGGRTIDARLDARILPGVFLPDATGTVPTYFTVLAEGAGFESSFGYYNVGFDYSPNWMANLHPIFGCGVPPTAHSGGSTYVQNAEPGSSTTVDFAAEFAAGRYLGGQIGFYFITPEFAGSRGPGPNCGDFISERSYFGRIYLTEASIDEAAAVFDPTFDGTWETHILFYVSPSNTIYLGLEDLYEGGDNDFEDMLIRITGLTVPASSSVNEPPVIALIGMALFLLSPFYRLRGSRLAVRQSPRAMGPLTVQPAQLERLAPRHRGANPGRHNAGHPGPVSSDLLRIRLNSAP